MQLHNHTYKNRDELEHFLDSICSFDSSSIFIQLFSGVLDKTIIKPILDSVAQKLPHATLIGASSAGEIIEGSLNLYSIILSVSIFESTTVRSAYYTSSTYADGAKAATELLNEKTKACIIFNEAYKSDSELFLDGFTDVCSDVMVAGGNASDDLSFEKIYVIHGTQIYEEGIVLALLDSDVLSVTNAYSFSWTPIGREMVVTKVDKNVVYEIDHLPIKELYERYLGHETIIELPLSAIEFPLVKEENGILIARTLIGTTPDGGFIFAGHFNEGDKIRFAIGNTEEILTQSFAIQKEISSNHTEATYVYSCVVRRLYLQDQIKYELGLINDVAPSVGFFTYGEFYHTQSHNKLLNITTTTLSLSESKKLSNPLSHSNRQNRRHSMLKSLTHLLNVTQSEYEENLKKVQLQEKKIAKQLLDETTKINNRTALFDDLKTSKAATTLLLINIDYFSDINNYYGHKMGDEFLKAFANKLHSIFKEYSIYRIGGDEFAIICRNNYAINKDVLHEILSQIENYKFKIKTHEILVSLSAGLATAGPRMVYSLAHIALKEARLERKKLVIFSEYSSLKSKIQHNMLMIHKIKSAIADDRIVPYFQGIVDNKSKKIVKYESLMRLIDEDGSVLTPYHFLEHAKKAKLYETLTKIMILKTFSTFERISDVEFSINLTLQDIKSEEITKLLHNTLKNSSASHRAVFEIVESEGIEEFEEISEFIRAIKSYGAKIAIDDFGTGYSNFSYLSKLNIDYIKIDGSLIKNINKDADHLLTVESILFFAQKKNIQTIAEFVEDEETFNKLVQLDVTFTQGYLFSIPSKSVLR